MSNLFQTFTSLFVFTFSLFLLQQINSQPNPLTTSQVSTGNFLFHLADYSGETKNLAEEYPEILNELITLFELIKKQPETKL